MLKRALMLLSAAMLMFSCGDLDPQPVRPMYYEIDKELNEKFFDKVCGEWHNEKADETKKTYEYLKLDPDSRYTRHIRIMSRKWVKINGVETLTDWEISIDETISGNRWELAHSSFDGSVKPYIQLEAEAGEHSTSYVLYLFNGADETTLYVETGLFDSLKRGFAEPGF